MDFLENLPDRLMTAVEVADAIGIKAGTLGNWRTKGRGPRFMKIGRGIYYDPSDIREWLSGYRHVQSTTELSHK